MRTELLRFENEYCRGEVYCLWDRCIRDRRLPVYNEPKKTDLDVGK